MVAAVRGVRAQVCDALRAAGWTATETQDARSALNAAVHTKPDAVVADLDMPGLDLSALLSGISASAEAGGVPIVGLSSTRGGPADALRAGVADFARKPVDPSEVAVRVVAAAQRQRQLNGLRRMALFDVLTGLYNRRHMLDQLRVLAAIAARRGDDFAAILVDVDGFKRVNDTHGHATGDEVLSIVARVVSQVVRTEDVVGRWGGEEFLVLLPRTSEEGAVLAAERILVTIRTTRVATPNGVLSVTASAGAAVHHHGRPASDVLVRADKALYAAKTCGRDQVMAAAPST